MHNRSFSNYMVMADSEQDRHKLQRFKNYTKNLDQVINANTNPSPTLNLILTPALNLDITLDYNPRS